MDAVTYVLYDFRAEASVVTKVKAAESLRLAKQSGNEFYGRNI